MDWYKETMASLDSREELPDPIPAQQESSKGGEDWYKNVMESLQPSLGTFETATGRDPRRRKIKDSPESLGIRAAAITATIEDPEAKLTYLAGERFPDLSPEEARRKYGYIEGAPVYLGDDGSVYREFPGMTEKIPAWLAENLPAMVGGAAGGARFGFPGAVGGAVVGLAGRKGVGAAHGDPRSPGADTADLAIEALLAAGGYGIGTLISKKMFDRRVVKDIGRFDQGNAEALQRTAKDQFGIDLTPAEVTELGSLINQQLRIGMSSDKAGDVIQKFLRDRAVQVEDAVEGLIKPTPPTEVVGGAARDVGKQAIKTARAERAEIADPLYKEFVDDPTKVLQPESLAELKTDKYLNRLFDKVKSEGLFVDETVPDNSIRMVDAVKNKLDDLIEKATAQNQTSELRFLQQKKTRLLKIADEAEPGYAQARATFEEASPAVTRLEEGIEGVLSRIQTPGLKRAAKTILGADAQPLDVARARKEFLSQGKEAEWKDVVNQYLRDIWEGAATKDVQGGANLKTGANFRKAVFGTKRQKQNIREALGPDDYKTFESFMEVLEATGRVPSGQSMTQSFQKGAQEELEEVAPLLSGAGKIVRLQWARMWMEFKAGNWRSKLADIITSPDSLSKLKILQQLSPREDKALKIAGTVIAQTMGHETGDFAGDYIFPIEDAPPEG